MRPPIEPSIARLNRAARYARTIYPGPVGEYLALEIDTWINFGWRIAACTSRMHKLVNQLIEQGEARSDGTKEHRTIGSGKGTA